MATVDYVVPARNNRDIIGATLESIQRQTVTDRTCCVVDDCSTDDTPGYVRAAFPWVRVVVKDRHSGPAEIRNVGAALGKGEYIVFVDSDATLESDWTEQQIRFLEAHPRAGVLCGRVLYAPQPALLHSAYGAMNRFGIAWDGGVGEPAESFAEAVPCLWANTTAIAVRREAMQRTGGFDNVIFGVGEDFDFGWRANLFGYAVMSNPAAVCTHLTHGTYEPRFRSDLSKYMCWRNRIRSMLVHYEWQNVIRYMFPLVLLSLGYAIAKRPRRMRLGAFWWNLVHLRDTLRRRSFVQRNRSVRDHELWHLFVPELFPPGREAVERAAQEYSELLLKPHTRGRI